MASGTRASTPTGRGWPDGRQTPVLLLLTRRADITVVDQAVAGKDHRNDPGQQQDTGGGEQEVGDLVGGEEVGRKTESSTGRPGRTGIANRRGCRRRHPDFLTETRCLL